MARLPSEQATSGLVDAHFSAENWSFPLLDENHFRNLQRRFQKHVENKTSSDNAIHLPADLTIFPALLFSVLSVTLQFITPDNEQALALDLCTLKERDRTSQWYLDTGQEIIELFRWQKPTTVSIEFHLMKMAWLKNCGRGDASWQSLGTALRQAQEIDLHQIQDDVIQHPSVDVGLTLERLWELEHRKRLWARIFIMDSHMAVALGRPRGIHREDCNTPTPLDCAYPREPSQTVPMSTKHDQEPPNAFSHVMFSIALSHKYHDLMSMRASKLDLKDYNRVRNLHNDIESLLAELPPALRPAFPDITWDCQKSQLSAVRLRLLTTANIFLLALHRPYVSTHVASRHAAIEAALTILQAQQELFTIVPQAQHKLYGYSFYTIDAGVFLASNVLKYSSLDIETTTKALQALQQASMRLCCMKHTSPIAKTGEMVLRQCCSMIEAHVPLPASTPSHNYEEITPQAMDLEVMNFLQGFGTQMPDQANPELMSLLAEPSTAMDLAAAAALPSPPSYHETDMLTFDASITEDFLPSNFTTESMGQWRI